MTLKDQLIRDEGFRSRVYFDSVGVATIGYGRNLRDKGVCLCEAETMLTHDILDAVSDLKREIPWTDELDEARRGALVNMVFNMGIGGLKGFVHFLAFLKLHRYELAAEEMLESKWAKQVGTRAIRLSTQIRTGTMQ